MKINLMEILKAAANDVEREMNSLELRNKELESELIATRIKLSACRATINSSDSDFIKAQSEIKSLHQELMVERAKVQLLEEALRNYKFSY